MLQFVCDYCENVKQPGETWINGLAAENVGTQAARREVTVDSVWRYERAILPLAVHFCSTDCKDFYLAELFQKPVSLIELESVTVEPGAGRRVIRAKRKPVSQAAAKHTTISGKRVAVKLLPPASRRYCWRAGRRPLVGLTPLRGSHTLRLR